MITIDNYSDLSKKLNDNAIRRSLTIFHKAAESVPAYKKFLKENSVDAKNIKSFEDFSKLPKVNKKNYLRKYPLNELCWEGNIFNNNIISLSSGSSGTPFFWPRGNIQHSEAETLYKNIYTQTHNVENKSTLLVVCFSMGTWIAGVYTTLGAFQTSREHKLNIITPGIEKEDAINAILGLHSYYDQIIIAGYPPFVKDIIDYGKSRGVNWNEMLVKFSFAGESISEEWRDNLISLTGDRIKPLETVNIYGTADMGVVGFETPLSIYLRRKINTSREKFEAIFGNGQLPTIVQYDQNQKMIEDDNGSIIITTDYGIPLIRYDIGDNGGLLNLKDLCATLGLNSSAFPNLNNKSILDNACPSDFIYLLRREDFSVSFYSLLIYPEHIKIALEHESLQGLVSGKFKLKSFSNAKHDQILEVHVELSPGVEESEARRSEIQKIVVRTLRQINSEYRKLYNSIDHQAAKPNIFLYETGANEMFKIKNKQKWV